jgi:elongation factor G
VSRTTGTALLSLTLTPATADEGRRLEQAVQTLAAEDPSLDVQTNPRTGQVVVGGMGELHLEIVVDRLKREFGVDATVGKPQVAYKERPTRPADGEMKYAKQTGGRGQYGHCKIHLFPSEPGSGYVFENETTGGSIPEEFIGSIDKGIQDALSRGVLAGHPIEDVRVTLYDGSCHDIESSKMAFEIAGALAFQDAARKAQPVLLEPVVHVEVGVPSEYITGVMDNLLRRRGQIQSQDSRDGAQVVAAHVPLSEMLGYAADLRSRTIGRGTYAMRLERYQPCPEPGSGNDRDSLVGAPRRPAPILKNSSVALPEPEEDRPGNQ